VGIGVGAPAYVAPYPAYAAPSYVVPAPAYAAPYYQPEAPVYYAPPPVVYRAAPVIVGPGYYGYYRRGAYYRRGGYYR
jgi:hypothetical protein